MNNFEALENYEGNLLSFEGKEGGKSFRLLISAFLHQLAECDGTLRIFQRYAKVNINQSAKSSEIPFVEGLDTDLKRVVSF